MKNLNPLFWVQACLNTGSCSQLLSAWIYLLIRVMRLDQSAMFVLWAPYLTNNMANPPRLGLFPLCILTGAPSCSELALAC